MKHAIITVLMIVATGILADKVSVQSAAENLARDTISKKDVVKIEVIEQFNGGFAVAIEYNMNASYSNTGTRKAIVYQMRRLAEKAQKTTGLEEIKEITICPVIDGTNVARIGLPMDEIKKQDWSGMMRIPENIESLARSKGELWYHPAIQ